MNAIGIDLGATRIKGVLVDGQGKVLHELLEDTTGQDWKKSVQKIVRELERNGGDNGLPVGLAAPGLPDKLHSCIAYLPGRLPGLEHLVWSEVLGRRVWVLNDAQAALMAEALFGAARDVQNVVLITLGTGVGGAVLIDGKLYGGEHQMAGHIGHVVVNASNAVAGITGMPGSLEESIGNASIERRSMGKFKDTQDVLLAMKDGDAFAHWLWLDSVRALALVLASASHLISPEVIVVGGGLSRAGEVLLTPLKQFLEIYEWRPGGKQTALHVAQYGAHAGAAGAAAFALQKSNDESK